VIRSMVLCVLAAVIPACLDYKANREPSDDGYVGTSGCLDAAFAARDMCLASEGVTMGDPSPDAVAVQRACWSEHAHPARVECCATTPDGTCQTLVEPSCDFGLPTPVADGTCSTMSSGWLSMCVAGVSLTDCNLQSLAARYVMNRCYGEAIAAQMACCPAGGC
jgi:hypothetical protein